MRHFGIRLTFREIVVGVDVVVHVRRADGEAKRADADAVTIRGEEAVEECGALVCGHVMDKHGAAAGERVTEAVDGLVGLRAVDVDDLAGGGFLGEGQFGRLLGEERGAVGVGEPESRVFLRESGQGQKGYGRQQKRVEGFRVHGASGLVCGGAIVGKRLFTCPEGSFDNALFEVLHHGGHGAGPVCELPRCFAIDYPFQTEPLSGFFVRFVVVRCAGPITTRSRSGEGGARGLPRLCEVDGTFVNRVLVSSGSCERGGGCGGIWRRRARAACSRRAGTSWRR